MTSEVLKWKVCPAHPSYSVLVPRVQPSTLGITKRSIAIGIFSGKQPIMSGFHSNFRTATRLPAGKPQRHLRVCHGNTGENARCSSYNDPFESLDYTPIWRTQNALNDVTASGEAVDIRRAMAHTRTRPELLVCEKLCVSNNKPDRRPNNQTSSRSVAGLRLMLEMNTQNYVRPCWQLS